MVIVFSVCHSLTATARGRIDDFMANLRLDDLRWGGFRIWQDPEGFCFSVDAVILAKFCPIKPGMKVLDAGCGNGILPLLLKAREPRVDVTGLELDARAARLAQKNMEENHVEATILHGDMMEAPAFWERDFFDCIISNPPYEKTGSGRLPKGDRRALARAEIRWDTDLFMKHSAYLLKGMGKLVIIHRPRRLSELIVSAVKYGLEPKRLRFVQPNPAKSPNLVLLEFVKGGNPGLTVEETLFVYNDDKTYHPMMERIFEEPK